MIFPYREITSKIRRPVIPIILKSPTTFMIYDAIIDSGADHCIFNISFANELGIKLSKKIKFVGIGNEELDGFWGNVELRIGNKTYQTKVIFAALRDTSYGILGQQGFFDHFDVKLSNHKQTIEIEPVKLLN